MSLGELFSSFIDVLRAGSGTHLERPIDINSKKSHQSWLVEPRLQYFSECTASNCKPHILQTHCSPVYMHYLSSGVRRPLTMLGCVSWTYAVLRIQYTGLIYGNFIYCISEGRVFTNTYFNTIFMNAVIIGSQRTGFKLIDIIQYTEGQAQWHTCTTRSSKCCNDAAEVCKL